MQYRLLAARITVAALFSALTLVSSSTLAAEWGIGAGVASSQKPYKDMSRDTTPLPLLYFDNQYLHFFGTEAEIKLPDVTLSETQQLNMGLIGRYDGSGYDADDADILDGMAKRKGGFWGGAKAEWHNPWVTLYADWTHDLSGNSKGQRTRLGAERRWQWGDFSFTPRIVASWHDKKYVDYYYGVRADEARDGRSAYQGASALSAELGLLSVYRFNAHHSVMLDLQVTQLSSEVKESPLVDASREDRLFMGYMYRF
ncbi:MipA/OmpV family protein [Trabulsiella odontotermitis]|uniref:MipA/OmpV family protein n=1 Tax=Trabulsiella odontotermitis TaxID=379893 RepID=UPI000676625D|nr:MipA/OmpV family protein [Trabulsiella odontotermitis]KNC91960.1 structural protein MipA [Trabulsiella odontotermitis]